VHGYGPAAARISIRARRQGTERHTKVRGAVSIAFGASQEQHGRWEEMLERAARERERERARDACDAIPLLASGCGRRVTCGGAV